MKKVDQLSQQNCKRDFIKGSEIESSIASDDLQVQQIMSLFTKCY